MMNPAVKSLPGQRQNHRQPELPTTIQPGNRARGEMLARFAAAGGFPHHPRNVIPARIQSGMVTRLTTEVAITTRRAVAVSPP